MNERPFRTRIKQLQRSMSLTSAIVALAVGVILPVLLSTSLGIVRLASGGKSEDIVFGVLVLSFAAAAFGSAIVVTVLLGKRARVARLQADFTANISHELRTPLASIRMYAQTLQMGRLDGDPKRTKESLEIILRETEWLEAMIDRVLAWRAASGDREQPEMKIGSMREAVKSAVARFERMVAPGEVDLKVSIECDTPVLHDADGMGSLLLNLLINAYKYSGSDKRIAVTVEDTGEHVEISVKDNGIGIPEDRVGRIFDPFYQIDPGSRGGSSGVGLGLAIVRHQARSHSGEVYVESEEGVGSRFSVLLPHATVVKMDE